jgi:hypothetical protein
VHSESSAQKIRASTSSISPASLSYYKDLQDFVSKVSEVCSTVEDGSGQKTLHIVVFLERLRDKTWADIKNVLSRYVNQASSLRYSVECFYYCLSALSEAAEKIGWPMPVNYPANSIEDRRAFEDAFSSLLKLQTMLAFALWIITSLFLL